MIEKRKKRKICALSLCLLLAFSLAGCSAKTVRMEGHAWMLSTLQNKDGIVIGCNASQKSAYPDAQELDLRCSAGDGKLSLTNAGDGSAYSGVYRLLETDGAGSSIYEVGMEEKKGIGVSAMTTAETEEKKTDTPTLVLTIDGYALTFYAAP